MEEAGEFNRADLPSHVLKDRLLGPAAPGQLCWPLSSGTIPPEQ